MIGHTPEAMEHQTVCYAYAYAYVYAMRMLFKERLIISRVLLLAEYISTARAGIQCER